MLLLNFCAEAQRIKEQYNKDSFILTDEQSLSITNKTILPACKEAIYVALFAYPELYDTKIIFRERIQKSPLSANITLGSLFRKKDNRVYKINISTNSTKRLNTIRVSQLSYNAQIGVLGHELAHIVEFQQKGILYFMKLALRHMSKKHIDKHEFNTDLRCIQHGLAYQLLAWSIEVRQNLNIPQWGGSNKPIRTSERYMNPPTIQHVIDTMSIYKHGKH